MGPPKLLLSVAESLTIGHLQTRIGAESGASAYFVGGITAYTLEAKVQHLGVERAEAERTSCVSARVAEQMAAGACRLFGTDLGLATTGWAEPDPAAAVPQPFAWWAIAYLPRSAGPGRSLVGRCDVPGASRIAAQSAVAEHVLGQLVAFLRQLRAG